MKRFDRAMFHGNVTASWQEIRPQPEDTVDPYSDVPVVSATLKEAVHLAEKCACLLNAKDELVAPCAAHS